MVQGLLAYLTGSVWRKGGAVVGRRFGSVKAVRLGNAALLCQSLKLSYSVKSQRLTGSLDLLEPLGCPGASWELAGSPLEASWEKITIFVEPDVDSEKLGTIEAGACSGVVEQRTGADGRTYLRLKSGRGLTYDKRRFR